MTRFFFTPKTLLVLLLRDQDQHMVGQLFPTTHSKSSLSSSFDLTQRQKREEDLACFTGESRAHKWPYPNFVPRHKKRTKIAILIRLLQFSKALHLGL